MGPGARSDNEPVEADPDALLGEPANRFDPESRRVRCVLAFGKFEFLARRWMRNDRRVYRDLSHKLLTDSWCHMLTNEPA